MGLYVHGDLPLDGLGIEDDFAGFGASEPLGSEWWIGFSPELKYNIGMWILGEAGRQGLPAIWDNRVETVEPFLRSFDRAVEDGGGFVVGTACYCPPTAPGGASQRVMSDRPCPAGSGGVGGTPVSELTAAQIAARLRETQRRERMTLTKKIPKISVTLPRDATGVIGHVANAAGVAIGGATITVGPPAGTMARFGSTKSTVTAADGTFAVAIAPGTYDVVVSAAGYDGGTIAGVVVPTSGQVDLGLVGLESVPDEFKPSDIGPGDEFKTGNIVEVATPWYKKRWVWAVAGGVVLLGGVAIVAARRRP